VLPFSARTRTANLTRMAENRFDVLVIGGGITGVGIALDAASRGFSTALVEKDDFASGTSGRSSRLVHGGLRYLEHREFGLVAESLRERGILFRLAPHLVRPIPMYMLADDLRSRATYRVGLAGYELLAAGRNIGYHRSASADQVRQAVPGLGGRSRGPAGPGASRSGCTGRRRRRCGSPGPRWPGWACRRGPAPGWCSATATTGRRRPA
jgi:glycerol-3-phosphate dehydrogenase